jgi:hypothetical protein
VTGDGMIHSLFEESRAHPAHMGRRLVSPELAMRRARGPCSLLAVLPMEE